MNSDIFLVLHLNFFSVFILNAFILQVANFEYIDKVDDNATAVEEASRQSIANKDNATNSERANYWEDLLKERYEVHQIEEFAALGKRKRSRKQVFPICSSIFFFLKMVTILFLRKK